MTFSFMYPWCYNQQYWQQLIDDTIEHQRLSLKACSIVGEFECPQTAKILLNQEYVEPFISALREAMNRSEFGQPSKYTPCGNY